MQFDIAEFTDRMDVRKKICRLEAELFARADSFSEIPTEHLFGPGVYCRKVLMKKGFVYIGKIHKHDHSNIVAQGSVQVLTEFGAQTLTAYTMFESPAGTKRALLPLEDTIWICVHPNPNNVKDLVELEQMFIAPTYEALGWESPNIGRIE
jgi:hypothetical protein